MDPVERLWAHEQIRQLAARYAVAADARDIDTLVSLFVRDVRVGDRRGREALRASFDDAFRSVGITFLNVGTHAIDVLDDDHASGTVYCKGEVQDGERWIHQAICYSDTYERRDGTWLFVRRVHELFYGAEPGVNPLGLPPAEWPRHADGRGTLPERLESWRAFWG